MENNIFLKNKQLSLPMQGKLATNIHASHSLMKEEDKSEIN